MVFFFCFCPWFCGIPTLSFWVFYFIHKHSNEGVAIWIKLMTVVQFTYRYGRGRNLIVERWVSHGIVVPIRVGYCTNIGLCSVTGTFGCAKTWLRWLCNNNMVFRRLRAAINLYRLEIYSLVEEVLACGENYNGS